MLLKTYNVVLYPTQRGPMPLQGPKKGLKRPSWRGYLGLLGAPKGSRGGFQGRKRGLVEPSGACGRSWGRWGGVVVGLQEGLEGRSRQVGQGLGAFREGVQGAAGPGRGLPPGSGQAWAKLPRCPEGCGGVHGRASGQGLREQGRGCSRKVGLWSTPCCVNGLVVGRGCSRSAVSAALGRPSSPR